MTFSKEMEPHLDTNLVIHIDWRGPYTLKQTYEFDGTTDFGVYQIYGTHHIYGSDVLLYIGRAGQRSFSTRLSEHGWCAVTPDPENVRYYVGRLIGERTPDDATWARHIDLAERLLIHSHHPAYNTQTELAGLERDLWHVQVANWGHYRSLLPEVSGARWTKRFDDIGYDMHYDTKGMPKVSTVGHDGEAQFDAPDKTELE